MIDLLICPGRHVKFIFTIISTFILLFISGCRDQDGNASNTDTINSMSVNQRFADSVLEAFYLQNIQYEERIRPHFSMTPDGDKFVYVLHELGKTIEEMIAQLERIDTTGVDSELLESCRDVQLTASLLASMLAQTQDNITHSDKFVILGDRLGSQQLEFEDKARKMGLEIYSTGR